MEKTEIFHKLENAVSYRCDEISDYMNEYFTQEERDNHGENLWRIVKSFKSDIIMLKLMDLSGKSELNLSDEDSKKIFGHLNK